MRTGAGTIGLSAGVLCVIIYLLFPVIVVGTISLSSATPI